MPRQSVQASSKREQGRQERRINLTDAVVAVRWLNAAKSSKTARSSYERVRTIRQQLGDLREARLKLKEFSADLEEWNAAVLEHEEKKKLYLAGKIQRVETRFPADRNRDTPEGEKLYWELNGKVNTLLQLLNETLRRYVFRPRVDYIRLPGSITILQNIWAGGMAPDRRKGWFETAIGTWPVSEADAALALVRLDLTEELNKVCLCDMCHQRWLVASKRSYRFCSQECREEFYIKSPDYHQRKADNQKRYRSGLKLGTAVQDAARLLPGKNRSS